MRIGAILSNYNGSLCPTASLKVKIMIIIAVEEYQRD